jgi:chromosome segregation ATPase
VEGNGKTTTDVLLERLIDAVERTREELRAEISATNAKLDQTREELGARIDQTNARLDQTNPKLDQRRDDLGTRIDGVKLEVLRLAISRADARNDNELRDRIERIEQPLGIASP